MTARTQFHDYTIGCKGANGIPPQSLPTRMKTQSRPFTQAPVVGLPQTDADGAESGLVLMNKALQPIAFSPGAADILRRYETDPGGLKPQAVTIPDEILAEIRERRASENFGTGLPCIINRGRYRCRYYVIESIDPQLYDGLMALHFEKANEPYDPLAAMVDEYHLTEREAEALRGIALGLSTKELADRMGISPNTVKSFIRLITIKLGVTSRAAIMVKLLESNEAG